MVTNKELHPHHVKSIAIFGAVIKLRVGDFKYEYDGHEGELTESQKAELRSEFTTIDWTGLV